MFRFENQQLLYWLLLVVFFIAAYIFLFVRDKRRMERYCERNLLGKLTAQTSHGMQHLKFAVLMLALVCFVFAAANPQTAGKMEKVKRKGVDIMLCLDVSNSMLATDIQPNRLDACKMAINRFIDKLTGDRVGLVVFAGKSFVQLPITTDYAAAKMFINQINTQMMPTQGTDISAALATAAAAMRPRHAYDSEVAQIAFNVIALPGMSFTNKVPVMSVVEKPKSANARYSAPRRLMRMPEKFMPTAETAVSTTAAKCQTWSLAQPVERRYPSIRRSSSTVSAQSATRSQPIPVCRSTSTAPSRPLNAYSCIPTRSVAERRTLIP